MLQLYVANGVIGIRDMGADRDYILPLRDLTATGRILGPRIMAAGPILDDAPGDWPLRLRVRNAEQGRAAVQLLKRGGVHLRGMSPPLLKFGGGPVEILRDVLH